MIMNKAYEQSFAITLISMVMMVILLLPMMILGDCTKSFGKQVNEPDYREVLVTKDDQTKKYKNVRTVQKNSHILNNNIDYEITLENGKEIVVRNPQAVETTPWSK